MNTKNLPRTNLLAALLATSLTVGCAASNTPSAATTTVGATSSSSAAAPTTPLSITLFSPPGGSDVAVLPASVVITFSESNLDVNDDANAVNNPLNYQMTCGSTTDYASTANYTGTGSVTLVFPSMTVAANTTCTVTAATTIMDSSGNFLSGTDSAAYVVTVASTATGTGSLAVSAFSPPSETVSSLPTSVIVAFNETNLDTSGGADSELNVSNYMLNCNGSSFYPSAATLTSSGVVTLTLPSESVSSGTSCTLTAGSNLDDGSGELISAASSVTYSVSSGSTGTGYNSTWQESSTISYTSTAGGSSSGSAFWDTPTSGLALSGINLHTGWYTDQITGVWEYAFQTNSSLYYGPAHGGSGGTPWGNVMCPSGMQMTGIYGTYSTQIDSIGILCASETGGTTYQSAAIGANYGTASFQISCPTGEFATDLEGNAGSYVQNLTLGCR